MPPARRPGPPVAVALGTFDPRDEGGLHAFIGRFRAGDAAAVRTALDATREVLARDAAPVSPPVAVVPVPDHEPGAHRGPRLTLARELALAFGWQVPEPPPLRRIHAVQPAKARGPREPALELASLAWNDAALDPAAAILLVDDVLASGRTLDACVAAIRRDAAHDREIRVLVLARALAGPGAATEP